MLVVWRQIFPVLAALMLLAGPAAVVTAQSELPAQPPASAVDVVPVVTGLVRPLYVTDAGDGTGRLFVVEQGGKIWIVEDGQKLQTPFLDVTALISPEATTPAGYTERGLLGLAFHPDYAENGVFFINYTDLNGNTAVVRYAVSADDPNVANPDSATTILAVEQPYANHNGGHLVFGPDGYLYIGMGDGGSQGDPQGNAQNLGSYLGKILRIDVDDESGLYGIPADNPFVGRADALPEIWAYGLRNPWRFNFDRETGDLWIGDVGGSAWEEVDFQPANWPGGANYGWNRVEGMHQTGAGAVPADAILPVAEYGHDMGISISGGTVYRGEAIPALQGVYLYSDFGSGLIWTIVPTSSGTFSSQIMLTGTGLTVSSFGEDEDGELYIIDYKGTIYQFVPGT